MIQNTGTGYLKAYADSGSQAYDIPKESGTLFLPITNAEIKYIQETANDDFDVYAVAYVVEGNVEK